MKKVEIHTKNEFMKPILDALKKMEVGGITVEQVRGRGQSDLQMVRGLRGTAKFVAIFNSRNLIYTIVNDDKVERIVKTVLDIVQKEDTESFGKIFITNVEDVVDLSTGKRGTDAI
ncbi:MAG: P-II family nitrogen regulator [Nitrosopumilus sp.]|nr:P-II family nitrogen regulator [Nitrosopumilus sp.]